MRYTYTKNSGRIICRFFIVKLCFKNVFGDNITFGKHDHANEVTAFLHLSIESPAVGTFGIICVVSAGIYALLENFLHGRHIAAVFNFNKHDFAGMGYNGRHIKGLLIKLDVSKSGIKACYQIGVEFLKEY